MKNSKNKKTIKYYVYKLTNEVNDKLYIGQTTDPKDRFYAQQYRGKKIKDAIQKIGWEKFHANLIEVVDTEEEANRLELHYIELYDTVNSGYNSSYKTHERRSIKKSAARNAKASATMSTSRWYFNPKTEETIRIVGNASVPKGFVPGRGGQKKRVKGHSLWMKVTKETPIAEIA